MKWRRVDNELARLCIQELQRNIHMGHIDPPKTTIVTPEEFDAWVLHFVHRTFEEEANNEWNNNEHPYDRSKELEEDLRYWKESERVF